MGNLCKIIVAKALKSCPKGNKSPNLVTLETTHVTYLIGCVSFAKPQKEKKSIFKIFDFQHFLHKNVKLGARAQSFFTFCWLKPYLSPTLVMLGHLLKVRLAFTGKAMVDQKLTSFILNRPSPASFSFTSGIFQQLYKFSTKKYEKWSV